MKTRISTTRRFAISVLAIAIAAASWTAGGIGWVSAANGGVWVTGMFSLVRGQGTSAHVVNTWTGDQGAIAVSWRVVGRLGNTLAQSERQVVAPGQASSFVFIPNDGDFAEDPRLVIRVVLTVESLARNKSDFIATQEVYDVGDGKTTVFLPYVEQ